MTEAMENILFKPREEILEYAQKRVGMETAPVKGRYPVEYDPIRRYCHMINDDNPLFLDSEYAKQAGYRDVVCPPLLISYFAGKGIWPPTGQSAHFLSALPFPTPQTPYTSIAMAVEFEFFKPVIAGDRLSSKGRIGDIYVKAIKRDPEAIWTVNEQIINNQNGEIVTILKFISVYWKR